MIISLSAMAGGGITVGIPPVMVGGIITVIGTAIGMAIGIGIGMIVTMIIVTILMIGIRIPKVTMVGEPIVVP